MSTDILAKERDAVLVEDALMSSVMGLPVLKALPSRSATYPQVDPFILLHDGSIQLTAELAKMDTTHPHRGFDNLMYVVKGSVSTGHSTGPGGVMERARLEEGTSLFFGPEGACCMPTRSYKRRSTKVCLA